jgi:hypothetical protein
VKYVYGDPELTTSLLGTLMARARRESVALFSETIPYLSYPFEMQWREALNTVTGYRGLDEKLHQSLKVRKITSISQAKS